MDSIIFDLDGTLWDSTEEVCRAWNTVFAKYGYTDKKITTSDLKNLMGLPVSDISRKLFPEESEDTRSRLIQDCCDLEDEYLLQHGGNLYPRLEETLNKLKGKYKLYIVSNCQDGYIQCFLQAHHLADLFDDIECWGATGLNKGQNIRLLMERNHLARPVYVGDTETDSQSAGFAGIPFVYARYGFGSPKDYDAAIDSFSQLLTLKL